MKTVLTFKKAFTIALIGGLLSACGNKEKATEADSTVESTKTQNVEVVKPTSRSFTGEISITGTAQPNQKVTIYAMAKWYAEPNAKRHR